VQHSKTAESHVGIGSKPPMTTAASPSADIRIYAKADADAAAIHFAAAAARACGDAERHGEGKVLFAKLR
jgi:hypothetical protein